MRLLGTAVIVASVAAATALAQPVQWRVEDGGNGHWYELIAAPQITWEVADNLARQQGGYLCTITSQQESDWVWTTLASDPRGWRTAFNYSGPHLGGRRDQQGRWGWVTGEPWQYTNTGSCFNDQGIEDRLHFGCDRFENKWNDLLTYETNTGSLIVEWSADCNADGIVDKGQILFGHLADVNDNGVPDGCEAACGFTSQPQPQAVLAGGTANLAVNFPRYGHAFQWRRNGVGIANSSRVSGATTATLSITQVSGTDAGLYDCVVTGPCGTSTSSSAHLTVTTLASCTVSHFRHSAGIFEQAIAIGDVNADGRSDLVIPNLQAGGFWTLLQESNGLLSNVTSPGSILQPAGGISTLLVDFDQDGFLDVAQGSYNSSTPSIAKVVVAFGGSTGVFTGELSLAVGTWVSQLAAGDLDGDGDADLVCGTELGGIRVWKNLGNRSFSSSAAFSSGSINRNMLLRRLNADSHLDLVLVNETEDRLSILINDGTGRFPTRATLATGSYPTGLAAEDFDNDGDVDLAIGHRYTPPIRFFMNASNGTFSAGTPIESPFGTQSTWQVYGGDFDRDGDADLVACSPPNGWRLFRNGPSGFQAGPIEPIPTSSWFGIAGRFNQDSVPDFVTCEVYPTTNSAIYRVYPLASDDPTIVTQPVTSNALIGDIANFSVVASGTSLSYQWRRIGVILVDDARVVGANTANLTILGVQVSDQASYDCVVTSPCGTITSAPATLSCKAAITTQPEGGSFIGGQQVTLSVVASNASGATYRWRKNGVNLFNGINYQGVSTPTLIINADEPSQSGTYSVAITNACGVTVSQDADVEVTCPADFNVDGGVDGQDVFEFFDAWINGFSNADINLDGGTDGSDVNAFYERWENGC